MRKPMGQILLIMVVLTTVEPLVVARLITRCLLPRGYIVAHTYTKGQEVIRCVRDTP